MSETLPFTYTGADLYALCSDAMLKAITRQAAQVDEKIKRLPEQVSTAYFFDHMAKPEDVTVLVTEDDFLAAKDELTSSVSQKELEHYDKVRQTFELIEEKKKEGESQIGKNVTKGKGKGKGKSVEFYPDTNEHDNGMLLNGAGNGAYGDATGDDDKDLYGE